MYPRKEKTTKPEKKLVNELMELVMIASLGQDRQKKKEIKCSHFIVHTSVFFFFFGKSSQQRVSLLRKHLKPKQEIKAACGTLMIFKECDSFDWCSSCLLHSMVSSA